MTQGVTVTDKEIEQYYNQNKQGQFTTPEQVQAEQITVPTEAAAKEVKQTLDKNADFRLVARTYSIDQYKAQGGTLPLLQRSFPLPAGVSPDVASETFKTPEGKVAGPLKVGNTWVILKVVSKKPQSSKTLAEVKDEIHQQLLMQKAQQSGQMAKFQQRMIELQRDADVQVGLDQYKGPIVEEQKALKQAPAPGVAPMLPGGR
jgi:parvulin-like peptidyl-prolyl isomerase